MDPLLWTTKEAADALRVREQFLRDSGAPRLLLPGRNPGGRRLLRWDPDLLRAWAREHLAEKVYR
jgi:hypothetical protein